MTVVAHRCMALGPVRTALLALANNSGRVLQHDAREWRTATFTGADHTIEFEFVGSDAVANADKLMEALSGTVSLGIGGVLVANAEVRSASYMPGDTPRMALLAQLLLLEEA